MTTEAKYDPNKATRGLYGVFDPVEFSADPGVGAPAYGAGSAFTLTPPEPEVDFKHNVKGVLDGIETMLLQKNAAYGNSALTPVRVFSKATPEEQILVRIDDKLSRIQRGHEFADEDTVNDLIGYLILLKIARK